MDFLECVQSEILGFKMFRVEKFRGFGIRMKSLKEKMQGFHPWIRMDFNRRLDTFLSLNCTRRVTARSISMLAGGVVEPKRSS